MIDFGYPQITSTEMLKICIHNEASIVTSPSSSNNMNPILSTTSSMLFTNMTSLNMSTIRTKPSGASNMPININNVNKKSNSFILHLPTQDKNEIYVDIIEKLTVLFNSNGYVINSSIDGCIQVNTSLFHYFPILNITLQELGVYCIILFTYMMIYYISQHFHSHIMNS